MKKVILIHILFFVFSSLVFAQRTRGGGTPAAANQVATPMPINTMPINSEPVVIEPISNIVLAPGDKKVFWVHGLTGSENSWRTTATKYATDRQMREYRPSYVEANGMDVAAHNLGEQLYDKTEFDQSSTFAGNLAIGHSQGGIVLRALDREKQGDPSGMRFGAYITVGSPNGGAPIIVSANNGAAKQLVDEIFTELSAGPRSQNLFTQLIGETIDGFKDKIVGFVADGITKQFLATTAQDFAYGSNWINTLNTASSNTPRVHIVGIETAPVHWKTISSFVLGSGAGLPFGQTNDTEMEEKVNKLRVGYVDKVNYYNSLNRRSRSGWFGFGGWLVGEIADWDVKAKQYQRGIDWMDNFGTKWARVIGAYQETYETVTLPSRTCCLRYCEANRCGSCTADCTAQRLVSTQYLESDGIVPQPNQELLGSLKRYVANGTNHGELLNHPEAQKNFNLIFGGDVTNHPNAARFRVDPR